MDWITTTNRACSYTSLAAFPLFPELVGLKEEIERGQHAPMVIRVDLQGEFGEEHCAYLANEACPYQQGMCVLLMLR